VLTEQYATWKDKPVTVDLPALWNELGIQVDGDKVSLLSKAPMASIREAIAADRPR